MSISSDRLRRRAPRGLLSLIILALLLACSGPRSSPGVTPSPAAAPATPTAEAPAAAPTPTSPPATPRAATATGQAATAGGTATARGTATRTAATPDATADAAGVPPVGPNDPSNGPLVKNRLVTYYGHPYSDKMGILGEYDPEPMIAKLKEQAAAYTAADPGRPALCTIELIASVAQNVPGNDNLWLLRTPKKEIEQYAQLAEKHGCLLLLDIQMGLDSVANEVEQLLPFLKRPYVHLAIDPEFHMKPGQIPGEDYGSVSAAEVMAAARVLSELVVQHKIPDKVLVVHQFRYDMLPDKQNIKPAPHVQIAIVMDGWGPPETKIGNYAALVRDEPIQYGGIKLFYRQDEPLLTPEEVVKLDPPPAVVIYQ